ncbi:heparan-alpha-glucosaminide N-acetyltransferase domain-containing protein [Pantoea sp. MBD-2R]|uniref:DUF1624 domain-containing protein n=1 Tax=Pantoea sp. MBD-2R TaxID=3141540 RepID=UPI0031830965
MPHSLSQRLIAIDALRGLVMLLMLLDHVRETFFLHQQVSDPIDVTSTDPLLFLMRTLAHLCAPTFVFLTGLSAMLYHQKVQDRRLTSLFLFKRGLVLILLELVLVNFGWTFQFPPQVIYLQVIWALGLSMLALAALLWLPETVLLAVALAIVAGHNLLDPIVLSTETPLGMLWAVLHQRGWIELGESLRMRTSYPVLPWIGTIALGYLAGLLYRPPVAADKRVNALRLLSLATLLLFFGLRFLNGYGEKPWQPGENVTQTMMSFFNLTKYPPSLLFLCLTVSIALALLAAFERLQQHRSMVLLAQFGGAPMFMYLLHLYLLKAMYLGALAVWGKNHGDGFGFNEVWQVAAGAVVLGVIIFWPVRAFAAFKARRRDIPWLKYF